MHWECTSCDKKSDNESDFKDCKQSGHTIERMLDDKQVIQTSLEIQDAKANPNNIFTVSVGDSIERKTILMRRFSALRPQTLIDTDTDIRMILVYLPTKIETIKGQGEKQTITTDFVNSAFFVEHKPNETTFTKKRKIPFNEAELKSQYKIDILSSWDNIRWEVQDLEGWIEETEPTNPKKLYELIDVTTRKYIEFPEEHEYCFFNLWNIGTYFYDLFEAYPGIDLTGTKRAGKTKVLELQKHVCFNAIMSPDMSGSSLFRIVEGTGATVLLDETENFKDKKNEMAQLVRRLIMQGMLKGQTAIRSESKDNSFTPKSYNIYSPKSMAHIQSIDDVMQDRFIKLLMKRAKNLQLLNVWPSSKDPSFQHIRNLCYRLFLDYSQEIYNLQEESKLLSSVSGRELQLWTPLITLASFFEKHGIEGLIKQIENFTGISSKGRQIEDEEQNMDLKILDFIDKVGVNIANDPGINKKNQLGWITISEIYERLIDDTYQKEYDIDPERFKRRYLTDILRRLGFESDRKAPGISYLLTRKAVDEIKERLGMSASKDNSLDTFPSDNVS